MSSYLENTLAKILLDNNLNFAPEYKFHPTRRWRFDFADLENKIAVELEGGIWNQGRHTRGSGFKGDTEKYNEATKLGWRILRYCDKQSIIDNFLKDYLTLIGNQHKELDVD